MLCNVIISKRHPPGKSNALSCFPPQIDHHPQTDPRPTTFLSRRVRVRSLRPPPGLRLIGILRLRPRRLAWGGQTENEAERRMLMEEKGAMGTGTTSSSFSCICKETNLWSY